MANETVTETKELQDRNKYLEDENANLMMMLEEYEDNIELLKTEIQSLNQKNDDLEVEASKYQSALGIATNFDYNDDQNLNVELNEDILALHDTLENYVTNLKPKIDVNINKAKELLRKYKCQIKISDKEPNKPLIKAVLQRLTEECMDVIGNFMKMVKSDDNSALSLQVDENEFEQTGSANSHVSN
ncbi:unnamed protein product [Rhizophagus irregularis]|nr:unnamed protein product [Rhizophagus irregularis]